jgi:arginine deiminase
MRSIPYGCDQFGRLTDVMLHAPGESLNLINEDNRKFWLFDAVPNTRRYNEEHGRYRMLLESCGVRVHMLEECVTSHTELLRKLPNLTFLYDVAVVSRHGAMLSKMAWGGRKKEDLVVREGLENLGIPIFHEFEDDDDAFEGFMILDERTLMVIYTERHKLSSIWKFMDAAVRDYDEIIFADVPKTRRYMHPDTIFNRLTPRLAIAYLPAFRNTTLVTRTGIREIEFQKYMARRGIELITVTEREQQMLACSFVPLESGVIIHYDTALDSTLRDVLNRKGIELVLFHPEAMLAGGGSLRCHTLPLHRETTGFSDS